MAFGDAADLRAPSVIATRIGHRAVDELLDIATRRRVCLLIGVAGWGKTAAVACWAAAEPVVRVRRAGVGRGDLVADIHRALASYLPGTARQADPPVSSVPALCERLDAALDTDLVLVIDDVHELDADDAAVRVLERLCASAPERLHLVLLSRREPAFSLERLRGKGLVGEISAAELALDVGGIADLLRRTSGDHPPGLATHIWDRTGGWPAAVSFAIESLRGVRPEQRLEALAQLVRRGERMHDWITEEVVGCEPAAVRELLGRLAVLGEVRAGAAITAGTTDAESMLADLTRRGLVRRDSSGDGARWTLIRPLRDYFANETVLSAGERAALHRTAARECLQREAPGEALRHLAAAGEHAACAELLREHGTLLLNSGHTGAVLEAAEGLAEYREDPTIQQVLGQARQVRGQWAAAMECFDGALENRTELDPAIAWRVAQIGFIQGEFAEVRRLYGRTRFTGEDTVDEAQMLVLQAAVCRLSGDLPGLRNLVARAVRVARRCGQPRVWAVVHQMLALQAGAENDRRRADAHLATALDRADHAQDLMQLAAIRVTQAQHLFAIGSFRCARDEAQRALRLSERTEEAFLTAQSLTVRGRAAARLGEFESAAADFATAIDLFQRLRSRFLAWALCGLGDVHRIQGRTARARAAYEEALALAEPIRDVFGMSDAFTGLALVRAADDLTVAHGLAERAVGLQEAMRVVPAHLARGWVALAAGDRSAARADAARAGAAARLHRDDPGLAEAITLTVLADRGADRGLLAEAIEIWHDTGCRVEEAAARLVGARMSSPVADLGVELARATLKECGIDATPRRGAGPLAEVDRAAPAVSIRTLGGFQVIRDGEPVPTTAWQSKKARDLVKVLIARRRPLPRDQLMELLWPDADPRRSGNRLSVLLSTVREVLRSERAGDEPLGSDGRTVWLNRGQVVVDVEEFLAQAAVALEAHRRDDRSALTRLAAAEDAHTGAFLEDDPYEEWVEPVAEEVRATYGALLSALVARLREMGDLDGVVRYSLRRLALDGYDEQAHLDLVAVLHEAGRLGEARRRYEIYVRRMREIGVRAQPMTTSRRAV